MGDDYEAPLPILVDTKKKDLVGNFADPGREWQPNYLLTRSCFILRIRGWVPSTRGSAGVRVRGSRSSLCISASAATRPQRPCAGSGILRLVGMSVAALAGDHQQDRESGFRPRARPVVTTSPTGCRRVFTALRCARESSKCLRFRVDHGLQPVGTRTSQISHKLNS